MFDPRYEAQLRLLLRCLPLLHDHLEFAVKGGTLMRWESCTGVVAKSSGVGG
jgi:hypothetical protein